MLSRLKGGRFIVYWGQSKLVVYDLLPDGVLSDTSAGGRATGGLTLGQRRLRALAATGPIKPVGRQPFIAQRTLL